MPKCTHHFCIAINFRYPGIPGSTSSGIIAPSGEDVDYIGNECGLEVVGGDIGRQIDVILEEGDPRLMRLYAIIRAKFGWEPSPMSMVPPGERGHYFGVERKVTWASSELDQCELLRPIPKVPIASHFDDESGQFGAEEFVATMDENQESDVQLGAMSPFHGLAVAEPLRSRLLEAGLAALVLPPVKLVDSQKNKKPLWALRSEVILPQARNPLINRRGEAVAPNTEWWCFHEDHGRRPEVLVYRRQQLFDLPPFDVALTMERVGQTPWGAYRYCIVSQKFRAILTGARVSGVDYAPVEIQ